MAKVKLLTNVTDGDALKVARRKNKNWTPPQKLEDGSFKESSEPEYTFVAFTNGTVIEMSDTSAEKYVEKGWGEIVKDEEKEDERPKSDSGSERDRKAKRPHAAKNRRGK